MRYFFIWIILLVFCVSCNHEKSQQKQCNLDSVDYKIYSILLDKYVIPEIDSTITLDEKNGKLISIKNPRRNLLLIDSTTLYTTNRKEPYLIGDSLLFDDFKKRNSFKCRLDTALNKSMKFYRISGFIFDTCLRKNSFKCYDEIYNRYKDVTGIVEFSKIGYNANKTKALVEICLYRGAKNSYGLFVWLEFNNGNWNIIEYKSDWVS